MSRHFLPALLLLLATPMAMAAPDVTIDAGASYSRLVLRGTAGTGSGAYTTPLHSGLGYDQATQKSAYFAFEHDMSWWPNVRLSHSSWKESAFRTQAPGMTTSSTLGIDSSDVAFYWSPVTFPFKLDLGVDAHRLNVDFAIDVNAAGQSVQAYHKKETQWFPAVYVAGRASLPLTGLSVGGSVVASKYDDRELLDARVGVNWSPLPIVGVELGYRRQKLKFQSEAIAIDMRTRGPYFAVTVDF